MEKIISTNVNHNHRSACISSLSEQHLFVRYYIGSKKEAFVASALFTYYTSIFTFPIMLVYGIYWLIR